MGTSHAAKIVAEMASPESLISSDQININALKVIRHLKRSGFSAWLVGGSVRDLLLGLAPKDFDVATDARPHDLRRLFRNSRAIGKRFRIVHVRFGREIIEVTTFRGLHQDDTGDNPDKSASGRLLRDNVYGTIEEDANRRDFTINALYYDPVQKKLLDFSSGIEDLQSGLIRLIGDPEVRYREDPVRMLRALRFTAKLGFKLDPETAEPLGRLGFLLSEVPPARLFDEVLKLFLSGHAFAAFSRLMEHDLLCRLFPDTSSELHKPGVMALLEAVLKNTDRRVAEGLPVTPAFLYTALLWPFLVALIKKAKSNASELSMFHEVVGTLIEKQQLSTALPRRFSQPMKEIWELQFQLKKRQGRRAERLLAHPRFRAGYDFLALRAEAGEPLQELVDWWTNYQEADEAGREALRQAVPRPKEGGRRKRRPRASVTIQEGVSG